MDAPYSSSAYPNYDLAPGGKHLAAMVAGDPNSQKPSTHLTFSAELHDEMRRRAAAAKLTR
jgi:hypothetical protein